MRPLEAKRRLERALHTPCLPYRITETRGYRANYYATTVTDVWSGAEWLEEPQNIRVTESSRMEAGFPALATLNLRTIGKLPIRIGVWNGKVKEAPRRLPTGVVFLVNGQRHGELRAELVSRLNLDYIKSHLLVGVDCTQIDRRVAEDLLMPSRDRLRLNEHYEEIREALQQELSNHQGLRDLNAEWRKKQVEDGPTPSSIMTDTMNRIIRDDPGFAHLFGLGDSIINLGPGISNPYIGRKFPTYFRLRKAPRNNILQKCCPINRVVRVEFETDAENQVL